MIWFPTPPPLDDQRISWLPSSSQTKRKYDYHPLLFSPWCNQRNEGSDILFYFFIRIFLKTYPENKILYKISIYGDVWHNGS